VTALLTFSGSATTGPLLRRVGTPAQDAQTQSWERGVRQVSRAQLMDAARAKISRLLQLPPGWNSYRAVSPTPTAGMVLNGILERLLFDDCATPQIAPLPDGGLEVEWLVAGNSVHADVGPDGVVYMDAHTPSGEEWSGEFPYWSTDDFLLSQAETFLKKISRDVEIRLLTQ
jgi:hypothetical protein